LKTVAFWTNAREGLSSGPSQPNLLPTQTAGGFFVAFHFTLADFLVGAALDFWQQRNQILDGPNVISDSRLLSRE
jgi:hypothetical protein